MDISGVGKIVEIDESMFGKRKCRGKSVNGRWVFGVVRRGDRINAFLGFLKLGIEVP